jgi:hypothetical protein
VSTAKLERNLTSAWSIFINEGYKIIRTRVCVCVCVCGGLSLLNVLNHNRFGETVVNVMLLDAAPTAYIVISCIR